MVSQTSFQHGFFVRLARDKHNSIVLLCIPALFFARITFRNTAKETLIQLRLFWRNIELCLRRMHGNILLSRYVPIGENHVTGHSE